MPQKSDSIQVGLGEIEYKRFPFTPVSETKAVNIKESTFEGYSAAIGNEDSGGDVIMPGAFAKSINERVASSRVKLLDQHRTDSTNRLLGKVVDAAERQTSPAERKAIAELLGIDLEKAPTHRLWSKFFVSSKQAGRDALTDVAEQILDGLSIGYRPVRVEYVAKDGEDEEDPELAWLLGRGVRKLHEVAWWETSLVIWGMNAAALVIPDSVKATLDKVAELTSANDATVNEKQVRYAIRALENLLGDEQEAEMRIKRGEFDALVAKIDKITDTFAHLDLTESGKDAAEALEEKAEEVIEATEVEEPRKDLYQVMKNIEEELQTLTSAMTETLEVEDDEKSESEAESVEGRSEDVDEVEEKEDAGDTDTEAKEADDASDADAEGHSDEHFEEKETEEEVDSFDAESVLTKLSLIELANREG